MIKTQEDFFKQYIYLSLYCKGSKRVTQGFRVRGSWRSNRSCNMLTPTLMAVSVVSFSFSGAAQPEVQGPSSLLSFSTTSYQQLLWAPTHQGFQEPPRPGMAFPTTSYQQLPPTVTPTLWLLYWLSYIIVQRPLDRPLNLWNGIFDRHQAEITVMQFRGHSLTVHHSEVGP